jgi:antirestriction protein ArdC
MPTQAEIRQSITEKIVAALRSGTVPFWRRPWSQSENTGMPTNAVSGKKYQGINTWLTTLAALEKGYGSKWWATYQQWQSLGGQVRRGEKGTQIILYKPVRKVTINDDGEEEVDSFPIMRTWTIFNIAQVDGDGLNQYRATFKSAPDTRFVDCGPAEEVIAATGAEIRHGGNRAVYFPDADYIQLPPKAAFGKPHEYYGVAGHELIHWTGHKDRLNRLNRLARFGDKTYAMEELVAELGSAFLLSELGIPQSDDLSNVVAYLGDWLKVLEKDHSAIFTASSASSKAVEFVISFSCKTENGEESEEAGELVAAE